MVKSRIILRCAFYLLQTFFCVGALAQPQELQVISRFGGWVEGAIISGENAFLSRSGQLEVISLDNYNTLGSVHLPEEAVAMEQMDDLLLMIYSAWHGDNSTILEIMDISNPLAPVRLSSLQPVNSTANGFLGMDASDGLLFLHARDENGTHIEIVDPSQPTAPHVVTTLEVDAVSFLVDSSHLYVIEKTSETIAGNNLLIFDYSDLNNIQQVGALQAPGAFSLSKCNQRLYVGYQDNGGVAIYDIVDVTNPTLLGTWKTGALSVSELLCSTDLLWVHKQYSSTLYAVDVSNPAVPKEVYQGEHESFQFIDLVADNLYMEMNGQFCSLDISTVSSPSPSACLEEPTLVTSLAIQNDFMYTLANEKLWIYSLDQPERPTVQTILDVGESGTCFVNGSYI